MSEEDKNNQWEKVAQKNSENLGVIQLLGMARFNMHVIYHILKIIAEFRILHSGPLKTNICKGIWENKYEKKIL
jgi:hypothetical protein